ncbi:MAG: heavy metal-binding domain-containing protein [Phycisphaerales bacterium]|nr:heavy metal-binding domain-containing protein [Phycisphaerales bacterium]
MQDDPSLMAIFFDLVPPLLIGSSLLFALAAGTVLEHLHLRRLLGREAALAGYPVTNLRSLPTGAVAGEMVCHDIVFSIDHCRSFFSRLKKIIGGRLGLYERLLDRARREAMVRLLEEARTLGYDGVCNVRMETSDIGGALRTKGNAVMGAVLVWGTAYRLEGPGA